MPSEHSRRSALIRYSIPIITLIIATVTAELVRYFGGTQPPPISTVAFLLAIMASAWWGGYVSGILASLVAMLIIPFAFTPHFNPAKVDPVRLLLLLIIPILISRVAQARNKAETALRLANETLDERVRQRTAELQQSNVELRRLNEDLNQFAYSASHDLQEPLRMMSLYSQLLERKYKDHLPPAAGEYIESIVSGARRMEMLLRDLLAYAHAVNLSLDNVATIDMGAVVDQALSNLSAAATEAHATVHHTGLPRVRVQEVHLLQLFQNLIGNAIKYRGDHPPHIEVSATRDGAHWAVCVRDNGIGISAENHSEIFRMFRRLHTAGEYEGTGMGLAICHRIVERYGGRIWVESEPGKGSTFCFTVPAAEPESVRIRA